MKIEKFEDIIAWQKAKEVSKNIYYRFRECRYFGFKDQIQRASVSIMNNIAEGFERRSNKELKQFLFIAKGSAGELRSMLYPASELKYINLEEFNDYREQAIVISKMLSNFIKTL